MITLCFLLFLFVSLATAIFGIAGTIIVFLLFGWIAFLGNGDKTPAHDPREEAEHRAGFTQEEILATGLYPDDEGYKMSIISDILNQ